MDVKDANNFYENYAESTKGKRKVPVDDASAHATGFVPDSEDGAGKISVWVDDEGPSEAKKQEDTALDTEKTPRPPPPPSINIEQRDSLS